MSTEEEATRVVPKHVGYILDGNRRWARQHSLPEYDGHLAGYNALREVIEGSFDQGVQYVSIYAFSSENWKRDKQEVSNLMKLAAHAISSDLKRFVENGICLRFVGRREGISGKLLTAIDKAEEATRSLARGTTLVCFNYGGQAEVVDATRRCIEDGLTPDQVTEQTMADRLYVPDAPPIANNFCIAFYRKLIFDKSRHTNPR